MNKNFLSIKDLAAELGIGRNSAYELAKQKSFPSFKVKNRILIPRDALYSWISAAIKFKKNS